LTGQGQLSETEPVGRRLYPHLISISRWSQVIL